MNTLNFAHRGFSGKYPENTLLAFEQAIEAGCDGIELDVQLSKDEELVILHDEALKRTTGESGYVWEYTLSQLKAMDASEKYRGIYGKVEIPTLQEYFELVKNSHIITNIELKTGVNTYPGIEKKVLALIDAYGLRQRVMVSSFNHYSAVRFKELAPEIPCGVLEESRIVRFAEYAYRLGMDYLHPAHFTVTEELAQEAASFGLGINTWTVNDTKELERLMELGVHSIIGNYPDRMKKKLREMREAETPDIVVLQKQKHK